MKFLQSFPFCSFLAVYVGFATAFPQMAHAQSTKSTNPYAAIDVKALAIPDSLTHHTTDLAAYFTAKFEKPEDRVRAAFAWVSSNIAYDVVKMYVMEFHEEDADLAAPSLESRRGICENYAAIFHQVCQKMGLLSQVVEGYTRTDGRADYIPHAWVAVFFDAAWHLYDPTWAAGYIEKEKFVAKRNDMYYNSAPQTFIQSHMPFDPIWQLQSPVFGFPDFDGGAIKPKPDGTIYNFGDSINTFLAQNKLAQQNAALQRIEANGRPNALVYNYVVYYKSALKNAELNQAADAYNGAMAKHNDAVFAYNDYINSKNVQFVGLSDEAVLLAIQKPLGFLNEAQTALEPIRSSDKNMETLIEQLKQRNEALDAQIAREGAWVDAYLSKGKLSRKAMFYK